MSKKIMLLGSGELGKEFVIAVKRLGLFVIAVDSYNNAPAQQVAEETVHVPDANKTTSGWRGDPTTHYGGWH